MNDTNSRINPVTLRLALAMLDAILDQMGEPEFSKWLLSSLRDKQADLQGERDARAVTTSDLANTPSWLAAIRGRWQR